MSNKIKYFIHFFIFYFFKGTRLLKGKQFKLGLAVVYIKPKTHWGSTHFNSLSTLISGSSIFPIILFNQNGLQDHCKPPLRFYWNGVHPGKLLYCWWIQHFFKYVMFCRWASQLHTVRQHLTQIFSIKHWEKKVWFIYFIPWSPSSHDR